MILKRFFKRGLEFNIRTILRPTELANDKSPVIETILHAADYSEKTFRMKCDQIMLLQPTYPIRDEQEITKAINFFEKNNLHSLVSVVNMKEHPCECISIYNQNNDDWQF